MLCDSEIGHECQNAVRPTGESAWDNNRTINNFSQCQAVSMATACFRPPKTEEEEISLRFHCLAEYENEQKSAVGNSWRQRT